MQRLDNNVIQLDNVLFTDESTFTLRGHVNLQNCRYWANDNPHWMNEFHKLNPEKVNFFTGIIGNHVIGPFFIDGNLNGDNYLALLQNVDVPTLANLNPTQANPQVPVDGAPPHYRIDVRQYLDLTFPNLWIGRR